jgi:hypothetical protein
VNAPEAIQSFIESRLSDWPGLPDLSISTLSEMVGAPTAREDAPLGSSTALRHVFELRDRNNASLFAWERNGHVVLIEISPPPGLEALEGLPEPTAILPQEIRIEGAYAHEYFFADRGLLLTIARSLESGDDRLVRCRGIRPMPPTARAPEPDIYQPLATRIKW